MGRRRAARRVPHRRVPLRARDPGRGPRARPGRRPPCRCRARGHPAVRLRGGARRCCRALGRAAEPRTRPLVAAALQDEAWPVRAQAARALGAIGVLRRASSPAWPPASATPPGGCARTAPRPCSPPARRRARRAGGRARADDRFARERAREALELERVRQEGARRDASTRSSRLQRVHARLLRRAERGLHAARRAGLARHRRLRAPPRHDRLQDDRRLRADHADLDHRPGLRRGARDRRERARDAARALPAARGRRRQRRLARRHAAGAAATPSRWWRWSACRGPACLRRRSAASTSRPREPDLLVIDKENGGKADSINAGLCYARYPLFCTVDSDTLIDDDALVRLVRPFQVHPETVACGGVVRIVNGSHARGLARRRGARRRATRWSTSRSSSTCARSWPAASAGRASARC